jgi:chromosomal replication initiation ATPase DnaA
MKSLTNRFNKARAVIQSLIEEMESIDREMTQMASGFSCDIPEVKIIQEIVASHYGLTPQIMMSAVRTEEYANARGLAMYMAKELTFHGVREIASCFGGRTHAMVIHAHDRLVERMSNTPQFANDVAELMKAARGRIREDLKDRKSNLIPVPIVVLPVAS